MNLLLILSGICVAIAAMVGIFAHSRDGTIWFTCAGVVFAIIAAFAWFQGTVWDNDKLASTGHKQPPKELDNSGSSSLTEPKPPSASPTVSQATAPPSPPPLPTETPKVKETPIATPSAAAIVTPAPIAPATPPPAPEIKSDTPYVSKPDSPERRTIREKSAAEINMNLKGITPPYRFREKVEELYLGRWTREPGWQATVSDLPSKLPGGSWFCSFKEVGSGVLVIAITVQDASKLRPGDSVTVSGRISSVSMVEDITLEDAILSGDNVPFP